MRFRWFWIIPGLALALGACGRPATSDKNTVTVLAASSLKKPMDALIKGLENIDPELKVKISYAGSHELAAQLLAGAPADLFASAGETAINQLVEKGLVERSGVKPFARNRLTIVFRPDLKPPLAKLEDLGRGGLKLVRADAKVPVGSLSDRFLDALEAKTPGLKAKIVANVASYEQSDLSLVTKVELGEADAAIVYESDSATHPKLKSLEISDELNQTQLYLLAPLKRAKGKKMAELFFKRVMMPKMGQQVLVESGFLAAAPAEYWIDEPKKEG